MNDRQRDGITQPQAQQAAAVPQGFRRIGRFSGNGIEWLFPGMPIPNGESLYVGAPVPTLSAWISVEERLPEKNTEVLVAFAGQSIASTGQYTGSKHDVNGWCYPDENRHSADDGKDPVVTHWQPLPAPPITEPGAGGEG